MQYNESPTNYKGDYLAESFCSHALAIIQETKELQTTCWALDIIQQQDPSITMQEACTIIIRRSRCSGHTRAVQKALNYLSGNTLLISTAYHEPINILPHVTVVDFSQIKRINTTKDPYPALKRYIAELARNKIENIIFDGIFACKNYNKFYKQALYFAGQLFLQQNKAFPFVAAFIG